MWDGCLASWNRRLNTRPGETPGLSSNMISAISSGLTPCRWVGFRMIHSLLWRSSHEGSVAKIRSEEHTSELQSLMRISFAVFCLKTKKTLPLSSTTIITHIAHEHTSHS